MLAIGMPYDIFWYHDFDMVDAYIEAHKRRIERDNQQAWLSGFYTHSAVSAAVSNAFRKKGSPPVRYMEEPIELFKKETEPVSDAEKLYNKFKPVIEAFNARRRRKEKR